MDATPQSSMPTFFLSQSSSTFSRPISSYSASLSACPFRPLLFRPSTKSSGSCSNADFLHFAIWMGCTLNCDPNWLSVFTPRIASIATRALNFGLYCFLVIVIDLSSVNDSGRNISLLTGLISGDHYSRGQQIGTPYEAPGTPYGVPDGFHLPP